LVLALAVLAVAVGAVMAVPPARTAVLEWLGLRGVRIERTPISPSPGTTTRGLREAELSLGERVTPREARRRARYEVLVPPASLGDPDAVYFDPIGPGGQVSFVYREGDQIRLLASEFRAGVREEFIEKSAGPGTRIESVGVNGARGWWLEGEPHEFFYVDPATNEVRPETFRLATNTLLWMSGGRTLRIEGEDLTRDEAIRIAEAFGPA
ncbi:MAG: hypothetical protein M3327_03415, partial [Actinomycetota bacterium]|nr:hypothetical protein [Actinomycetota bacterium]